MIYEGLGLPRVEFAAADVRDNDYDAYVPTYLTLTYPSYLPTHLSIFGSSLLFASSTYDGTYDGTLFFALSLSLLLLSLVFPLSLFPCTYGSAEALWRSLTVGISSLARESHHRPPIAISSLSGAGLRAERDRRPGAIDSGVEIRR